VIDRIPGPDGSWDYATVDAAKGRVLVGRGGRLMAVDLATRRVVGAFSTGAGIHGAWPINGGAQILLTNGGADTAAIVDAKTGALIAALPTGRNPDAAVYDPSTGLILVMNHTGGDITLIDPETRKVTGTIVVGGELEAGAVDGNGRVYVNVEDKGEVAVIDVRAAKVVTRYKLPGCEGPTGIAYAPADGFLISSCERVAVVLRAVDGKPVKSIPIGLGADGVVFDTERKLAFVSSGVSGEVSVISIADGSASLVGTVPTQVSARTIALDQRTGRLYLPAARYGPRREGNRPVMRPGTFELLVVGR
jgi:YVTN family beta-propeller protein